MVIDAGSTLYNHIYNRSVCLVDTGHLCLFLPQFQAGASDPLLYLFLAILTPKSM